MRARVTIPLDHLPMFASDEAIGAAVLGAARAKEWSRIARLYERQGMPKVDPVHGGRYVAAVKRFYDHLYRLDAQGAPAAPDGVERPEVWTRSKRKA